MEKEGENGTERVLHIHVHCTCVCVTIHVITCSSDCLKQRQIPKVMHLYSNWVLFLSTINSDQKPDHQRCKLLTHPGEDSSPPGPCGGSQIELHRLLQLLQRHHHGAGFTPGPQLMSRHWEIDLAAHLAITISAPR